MESNNNFKINYSLIGEEIGHGIDGRVFEYGPDKVIKKTNAYTSNYHQAKFINFIHEIQQIDGPFIVKIFGWDIDDDGRICYVMERLLPLSFKEETYIDCLCDYYTDEDLFLYKTDWCIAEHLVHIGLPRADILVNLLRFLVNFKYRSNDLIAINVRKNSSGQLVLIDVEQFFYSYEGPDRDEYYLDRYDYC
jgi:hypothetical protein